MPALPIARHATDYAFARLLRRARRGRRYAIKSTRRCAAETRSAGFATPSVPEPLGIIPDSTSTDLHPPTGSVTVFSMTGRPREGRREQTPPRYRQDESRRGFSPFAHACIPCVPGIATGAAAPPPLLPPRRRYLRLYVAIFLCSSLSCALSAAHDLRDLQMRCHGATSRRAAQKKKIQE